MRLQLGLFLLLSSALAYGDDKVINELFRKYEAIMDEKKVELVEEVFSQKFLKEAGGKEVFIKKVKSLPKEKGPKIKVDSRPGPKPQTYMAKISSAEPAKSKASLEAPEFIIVKEDGKLKIDGTLGDDE